MNWIKKVGRVLFSMKTALVILVVLALVCTAGSVIPQKEIAAFYENNYPEKAAQLILLLGLDDVFHVTWFVVLAVFLCVNLLGCNIVRFPSLVKRMRSGYTPEKVLKTGGAFELTQTREPEALFKACGFSKWQETKNEQGAKALYAVKNKVGIWGAWLCHLGMLIVIVGFSLGQMKQIEYAVYGVPGQTKAIDETGYELTIDDFVIGLREDDTVDQYTATITVKDTATGEEQSGQTSVNHPLSLYGMRFYQNSTGWAATARIYKDKELLQENLLCAGEYTYIEDKEGLALTFSAFYPDYVEDEAGMPRSASSRLNNPAYLYRLYFNNQMLGMNVLKEGEVITVDDYVITLSEPQQYTLIQIKRDPFTWLAAIGAILMMAALMIAFYLRTAELWMVQQENGAWMVCGRSRKGGVEFEERIRSEQDKLMKN
ncbi:MAG: cytochrome c biogenesis protein ResB [Lachnospiraceae bacterium]|nr:cytochrome c biogenesis protein ResB [Lachnospiraceae bacterium]